MGYTRGMTDSKKPHQGNNIRKLRGLRQKSQKELADIIGVSPDTLRVWENKPILEPTELKKVSNGLYVHPAFIEEIDLEEHFAPVRIGSVAGDNNLNAVHNGSITYTVTNPANQTTIKELIQALHKITQERDVLIKTLGTVTAGNDTLKNEVEKLKLELENTKKILKTL